MDASTGPEPLVTARRGAPPRRGAGHDGRSPGDRVLAWLSTPEARKAATSRLRRSGFTDQSLVDDVLSEAAVNVLVRMQGDRPLRVDRAAAYGSTVIRNVVNGMTRGTQEDVPDPEKVASEESPVPEGLAEPMRLHLERAGTEPWLTSAALAYVCLAMAPDEVPGAAPAPVSGANHSQALAWAALWYAGLYDLFPDREGSGGDPRKRQRGRRVAKLLDHMRWVSAASQAGTGGEDG